MVRAFAFLTLLSACWVGSAFVVAPESHKSLTARFEHESRRGFLVASVAASVGILSQGTPPALAIDDLAMPSEAEAEAEAQKKAEMEARLARKAELKAKASSPKTFQESMKGEMEKQKKDKAMSGEERRNALCEDLGRGC